VYDCICKYQLFIFHFSRLQCRRKWQLVLQRLKDEVGWWKIEATPRFLGAAGVQCKECSMEHRNETQPIALVPNNFTTSNPSREFAAKIDLEQTLLAILFPWSGSNVSISQMICDDDLCTNTSSKHVDLYVHE
jgi:hypothetical protein